MGLDTVRPKPPRALERALRDYAAVVPIGKSDPLARLVNAASVEATFGAFEVCVEARSAIEKIVLDSRQRIFLSGAKDAHTLIEREAYAILFATSLLRAYAPDLGLGGI
jgi:hypothetical protein